MIQTKLTVLSVVCALVLLQFASVYAGDKGEDTIILGGEHGCGPKLLLKTGGKKKGDILVMNDCKKKHKQTHFIPYPVYTSYGGGHGGGYGGHGGY